MNSLFISNSWQKSAKEGSIFILLKYFRKTQVLFSNPSGKRLQTESGERQKLLCDTSIAMIGDSTLIGSDY